MAISESYLDELISRSDIADVVGSYVNLSKRSGSNLFGLCPFHNEKTPSFSVSPEKQIYHCFGCGKGGGVINFIMEIEGLGFQDAVAFLARRAGMPPPEDGSSEETRSHRGRLLDLNKDAARFYYQVLNSPAGAEAMAYMQRRQIDTPTAVRFGLGAAPDAWTELLKAMKAKGYNEQEMFEAGLIKRGKNGGFYDTFRNRLMFPVIDIRGSVLGFSGRALGDSEPKYLNSPDTPVFNKSKNLFAINLAKKCKDGPFILCEGNIDVVSLHQAGFTGAVASLGTSLTSDQARLLSRYTDQVVLAYDGDAAGIKAADRAIKIFEQLGMKVRVLRINGAKDPDEYIKRFGADAFGNLIQGSPDKLDYQIAQIRAKYDVSSDSGRLSFLNDITVLLSQVSNSIEREVYAAKIAEETGVSKDAILSEAKKIISRRLRKQKQKTEQMNMRPGQNRQPADRDIRYTDPVSASAEEGVLRLLMLDPTLLPMTDDLKEGDFSSPFLFRVLTLIRKKLADHSDLTPATLCRDLTSSEASRLTAILDKPENISEGKKAMNDYLIKIRYRKIENETTQDLAQMAELIKKKKGMGIADE
ncbi:MAG: DNA primase [Oscillospiraceae bacterium]|nr:DNA primase [Oscillospiraceae bacterium]